MNRELRRLQEREERRQKRGESGRPSAAARAAGKRERTGIRQFLREVRQELAKVSWPDRRTLWTYTVVSLITTVALTAYTALLDFSFQLAILRLILRQ